MPSGAQSADFTSLYTEHHDWLFHWFRRRLGCASEAADLTHDTYVRFLKTEQLPTPEQSRPYLMQVAKGLAIDWHRRRALELAYLDALALLPQRDAPSIEQQQFALETLAKIDQALNKLPDIVRETFLYSRFEGMSYPAIAEHLDISESSVRRYLQRAVRRIQPFSEALDGLPGSAAAKGLRAAARSIERRKFLLGVSVAALAGMAPFAYRSPVVKRQFAALRTATGERRMFILSDGARVMLNTASAVALDYTAKERHLHLIEGEIMVATAADPTATNGQPPRPFVVETRHGRVSPIGTRFIVRQTGPVTRVMVNQGKVVITPQSAPDQHLLLDAGEAAEFSKQAVRKVPASGMAGWIRGKILAEQMPLGEFIAELNRHRAGYIHCRAAVADIPVSGAFPVDDIDRALAMLADGLSVNVRTFSPYLVVVGSR